MAATEDALPAEPAVMDGVHVRNEYVRFLGRVARGQSQDMAPETAIVRVLKPCKVVDLSGRPMIALFQPDDDCDDATTPPFYAWMFRDGFTRCDEYMHLAGFAYRTDIALQLTYVTVNESGGRAVLDLVIAPHEIKRN